ncbi:response regulator transcription factor [Nocardioides carbamazepini]|uniref:response regulator transcription factor n=1 Tax=Nocardioides carbamazepini TaxID=2854259 RepID=UPI00214A6C17|nr:response regulator transcription factor [Nocardioides carbamazepini]MCR1784197.1 response regulator transcription factor [Nocardioides carbamazepini]
MNADVPPGLAATAGDEPMAIVAVDDHPVVLEGLRSALGRSGFPFDWLGSTSTARDLVALLDNAARPATLALVDLHLGDAGDTHDLIGTLTGRGVRCVVLTSESRPVPLRRAVEAGAVGLILKSDPIEQIVSVLEQVEEVGLATSSELAHALVTDDQMCARLAPRELEVLQLLSDGHTRRSIARSFDPPISESTVSTYVERVFQQYRLLGRTVRNTVEAVREAAADGYFAVRPGSRRDGT